MAIINSDFEENLLLQMLNEKEVLYAWIGAHDHFEEDDWVTVNGETLKNSGYSNWRNNESNNLGGKQHCAVLVKLDDIDDYVCTELQYFFCEISI